MSPAPPPSARGAVPAVVLLSGGLDSATCLAIARAEGYACTALSFRYGQRHAVELEAAARLAADAGIDHVVLDIDLRSIGGSALTADIAVPKHADDAGVALPAGDDIPVTYVPARNTIFLAHALAVAEVRDARDIFIGVNALDYSGYPDCRPEFIEAFERVANLATRAGVTAGHAERIRIHTPLISLSKAAIVRKGVELGVDHAHTISCYDPVAPADGDGGGGTPWAACGRCDACVLRLRGFRAAGLADPAPYASPAAPR